MNATQSIYAQRRARLASMLGAGGIAIIPTAPERPRNRDTDFIYRHDSYFYYLTGFAEPGAVLVLTAEGHSTLFCQPKDLEREIWDGYRLGPAAAPEALGVNAAQSSAVLDAQLPRLLENRSCVWYPFATHTGLAARVEGWLNAVRARVRYGALCPAQQSDVCTLLDEMRLIKDAHELDIMRRASQISAQAHIRAMQRSARMLRAGQDVREYHLDAELLHDKTESLLLAVHQGPRARCGLAWMSVTQGVVYLAECATDELSAWLARTTPSELLYSAGSTERFEQQLLGLRHNATLACPLSPRPDWQFDASLGCPQLLEHLQAVHVVGVVVGQDDVRDLLRRDLLDLGHQPLGQRRRAQRVDHHHAGRGDNKARVGDEVLVGRRAQRRQPLDKPAAGRDLMRLNLGQRRALPPGAAIARPRHAAQGRAGAALNKLTSINHTPHDAPLVSISYC